MPARIHLLVIDPQIDFCEGGALAVPGATADMERLAAMVDRLGKRLADISVTLDSHHTVDIAHPGFWVDSQGTNPAPFTLIRAADIEAGTWTPRHPALRQRVLNYVRELERKKKFDLIVWPEHCEIGTPGAAVQPSLFAALKRWCKGEMAWINFVTKGSNPMTEHYSAVQAEVPDPEDPGTMLNAGLIKTLQDSDVILIAGEALSHCLKSTVEDIADNIGEEHVKKFVLLTDCTSSIPAAPGTPDFPAIAQDFIERLKARGMRTATSADYLATV